MNDLKKILQKKIKIDGKDHSSIALLASIYKNENKLSKAHDLITDAIIINSSCPIVLWHFADILEAMENIEYARITWSHLLNKGFNKLKKHKCNNFSNVEVLLNESRYRLSISYEIECPVLSKRYLTLYKKYLKKDR